MRKLIEIDGYKLIVSDDGRVWTPHNIEMHPGLKRGGYKQITLSVNNKRKTFLIHRLVATAFLPNPNNLPQVNHIDGDKQNNAAINLEWCTPKQNMSHSVRTGLRSDNKRVLCTTTGETFLSQTEAAKNYDLNVGCVSLVCRGYYKQTKGYHFKYID